MTWEKTYGACAAGFYARGRRLKARQRLRVLPSGVVGFLRTAECTHAILIHMTFITTAFNLH